MLRIRASLILGVAFAALLLAGAGSAQVRQKESANFALTGQITAIDAAAKTITVKGANGEGGAYVVNDKTTIMSGDKKLHLADLQQGWRVVLNGDVENGANVATYMDVVDKSSK